MKHALLLPALALLCLGSVSACSDIKGAIEFADDRSDFQARRDALDARSNTAYTAVPTSGSTTYTGEAQMGVGSPDLGVALIGDATVTINYGNGTVEGQLGNFSGFDTAENFSDYSGVLVLENGILGTERPNDVDSSITGTLTGESYTIDVDALWNADLKGTPIRGVLGRTVTSQSSFELNGTRVPGGIIIAVSQ